MIQENELIALLARIASAEERIATAMERSNAFVMADIDLIAPQITCVSCGEQFTPSGNCHGCGQPVHHKPGCKVIGLDGQDYHVACAAALHITM